MHGGRAPEGGPGRAGGQEAPGRSRRTRSNEDSVWPLFLNNNFACCASVSMLTQAQLTRHAGGMEGRQSTRARGRAPSAP